MTSTHTPGPCSMCATTKPEGRQAGTVTHGLPCGCTVHGWGLLPDPWHIHQCSLHAAAPELLEACKAQHDAIDLLFAMLMERDSTFSPRKSGGQPWKAIQLGNAAIAKAERGTP